MKKFLRNLIQYTIILLLTAGLLWLSLRGLEVGEGENKADFLWSAWEKSSKSWLLLMAVVAYISHVLRAERWRMLLIPTGNQVKLSNSFFSLMVGYLVNLAIPRGGEVSRCYNLYRLENTPVEVSFGTVVLERLVDVLCLALVIVAAFFAEWKRLVDFLNSLGVGTGDGGFQIPGWVFFGLGGVLVIAGLLYAFRKNEKLLKIIRGFREGLMSVIHLKHKWLFATYSVLIWFLYFLMSYCVVKAFDTTAGLGFSAVLTLFALGAIAMAAPLPGGTGSYHTIVPLGLVMIYKLPQDEAIAFVFIFHAWQTLTMIAGGVVSLLITYLIVRWREPKTK